MSNLSYIYTFNDSVFDWLIYVHRSAKAPKDIAIVQIDDKSINKIGRWPWQRNIHAQLLDKLFEQKAKVAAFYLKFDTFSDKESDDTFIEALSKYNTIIINSQATSENNLDNHFWNEISKTSLLGHNIFPIDKNNIIRRQFLYANTTPSFAMAVVQILAPNKF